LQAQFSVSTDQWDSISLHFQLESLEKDSYFYQAHPAGCVPARDILACASLPKTAKMKDNFSSNAQN
jgi:hypothetical protein